MTTQDWTTLSEPDPEFKAAYDNAGPIPRLDSSINVSALREAMGKSSIIIPGVSEPLSMNGVKKTQISIPVRDGTSIAGLLYQPEQPPKDGSALFVAYHGGGWCTGTPEYEQVNCVNAVQHHGMVAVSVDYRLAPEHPFPTAIHDSWDALQWIVANAARLGSDLTQGLIIHGESAGGNIVLVLALLARDKCLSPPLTGVSASIPAVVTDKVVPERFKAEHISWKQNKDAPVLDLGAVEYFIDLYKPDLYSALFCPLNWPTGHREHPPTFFQICAIRFRPTPRWRLVV